MREITRVEDSVDEDGYIIPGYTMWTCPCGSEVRRYRGQSDVMCQCGQWFNAGGQPLRSGWRGNPSNWDEDISDLDGYEIQYGGDY
jgi:hypothetical protein